MDESSSGAPDPGPATGAVAAVVVRQSRLQRDGLFCALVAVFLIALARGYPHAQTVTGRVVLVVISGEVGRLVFRQPLACPL